MQAEPGLADPLAGIGDQAVQAGPMLLIRRGEDLITLTLSGVDEDWATVAKAILDRGSWPEAVVASGDQPKDAAAPAIALPDIPDRLGGVPGVRDLLAALTGQKPAQPPEAPPPSIAEALARPASLDQPCPSGGPEAESEMAAEAGALVPMKPGTTLSYMWTWQGDEFDHECLVQVTEIGADAVTITEHLPDGRGPAGHTGRREVCRTDMRDALARETKFSPGMPVTIGGSTYLSLSRTAFRALKAEGAVWHRYLEIPVPKDESADDLRGRITRTSTGTVRTIVNDKVVELPVIFAEGTLYREPYDGIGNRSRSPSSTTRTSRSLLDYAIPGTRFRINFTKITYPAAGSLEEQLAADSRWTSTASISISLRTRSCRNPSPCWPRSPASCGPTRTGSSASTGTPTASATTASTSICRSAAPPRSRPLSSPTMGSTPSACRPTATAPRSRRRAMPPPRAAPATGASSCVDCKRCQNQP